MVCRKLDALNAAKYFKLMKAATTRSRNRCVIESSRKNLIAAKKELDAKREQELELIRLQEEKERTASITQKDA